MRKKISTLIPDDVETVSMIGLSKNAGKTTVLNVLVQEMYRKRSIGLLSIGIDGEERDVWSGRPKPPVFVPEGCWVATADNLLNLQPETWQIVESTSLTTVMGRVMIARARRDTSVQLAGIHTKEGIQQVLHVLKKLGVSLRFIDGAYNRKTSASPLLAQGVFLVVGAAAAISLPRLETQARDWMYPFTLMESQVPIEQEASRRSQETKRVVGIHQEGLEVFPFSSLFPLQAIKKVFQQKQEWSSWVIPGACSERFVQYLLEQKKFLTLIIPDATHLFVSYPTMRQYTQRGGAFLVGKSARLLGVAINPVSPDGYSLDPVQMKQQITQLAHPLPVFDVVRDNSDDYP
ncbi:hypothetical protein [Hazenella coriacea]|uniref:Uncharacterized protein n=1 Tax=Hazenella coriacea TaxID=1179467 RepID=A0A4V2UVK2_9BACL|nr:hypothetical protein [Hazenella coriacea]TCS95537.1 hypothetical protein EDD58_102110 [Hazenella coriacea]